MTSKRKKFWGNNPKYKQQRTVGANNTNRFQELSDLEDEDNTSLEDGEAEEYVVKVPPIVVDPCQQFSSIMQLLGKDCKYKRMTIGTKIMPINLIAYETAIKKLKDRDMKFFTHPIKDQKRFKLMLFGLPQLSLETIIEEFKNTFNITPLTVKEITTPRSNPDDALYMVEFDRSQISKKEVTRIKYFLRIVIQWRNPLRRSKGPTQCSKCAMFGHGSANCHRKNACLGCGGPHDYSVCQLNKSSLDGPIVYKCFNCASKNLKNINHRADDLRCPSRREYLEIRERVSSNRKKSKVSFSRPGFVASVEDFPSMNSQYNKEPAKNISWPSMTNRQKDKDLRLLNHEDDDISNEKILEIYFEALDALQKCKNKYDKMRVLGMMLKHVI